MHLDQKRHLTEFAPNGLPFNCHERATTSVSKPNDLAREAVSCNGVLLECTCSQWSGVVNSGHGAYYPTRDARRERMRGEAFGRAAAADRVRKPDVLFGSKAYFGQVVLLIPTGRPLVKLAPS
jgi:hypothetical protein